jgi:hypothetical protein
MSFNTDFEGRYERLPETEFADSGYDSEDNYEYAGNNNIQLFIKYLSGFHAEQKKKYRNNAFLPDNLFCNKGRDYFVCSMGQRIEKQCVTRTTNESEITTYQAKTVKTVLLDICVSRQKGAVK